MSTTIDSLDIQISTSAGNSAQKIDALASALGRLKANAALTKVTNNLTKLATALNKLNSATGNMSGITRLSTAMNSLASIQKLSGLSSAMNTLKRLPDVIKKLQAVNLNKFIRQMRQLAQALAPLATQLNRVAAGFARLPSQISKTVTAANKMNTQINTTNVNMMSSIFNISSIISLVNQFNTVAANVLGQAIEWDGIQFRFGRAFGEDAEEVYQYVLKINDVLGINTQEFMQYSSLYGSLLSGFGMAQEKVTTISVGLTELSYDIWAAYNDRFKTLEDASEAVRSAITGEIEPIRNAGIALTEASLQEFIDSTHLAGVSIEKLTEAQKSEVRYAAMVNAAMNQGIVGTYASEMQTAEGAVRSLSQSFKTLVQAVGSLFIPILQIVVPYMTAFVELLTDAVFGLAAMFGIDIQKIDWGSTSKGISDVADGAENVASGLGDAASKAKKLKDYTMGFDELNVISPDTGSDSKKTGGASDSDNGWGAGLDLDTLWDESVFAKASKQIDQLKEKLKSSLGNFWSEWGDEIKFIGKALSTLSIAKLLSGLGTALDLGEGFLGKMEKIQKIASTAIVVTVQYSVMTELFDGYIDGEGFKNYLASLFTGALGTAVLYSMWGKGGLVIGLGVTAIASLSAVVENGGITNGESFLVALTGLATGIGSVTFAWKLLKETDFGQFILLLKDGGGVIESFAAAFPKLAEGIAKFVGPFVTFFSTLKGGGGFLTAFSTAFPKLASVLSTVGTFIANIIPSIAGFLGLPIGATIGIIIGAIVLLGSVIHFLRENWDELKEAIVNFFEENIAPKIDEIKKHFETMLDSLGPIGDTLKKIGKGIANFFSKIDLSGLLKGIGVVFEWIGGILLGTVMGVIATAFNVFMGLVENAIQIISGVVQIVTGIIDFIVALFSKGDIGAAWKKIWDGVVNVFKGIVGAVVGIVVDLFNGVVDWFTELWDVLVGHSIVPDTVDAIIEWFELLPQKVLDVIKGFVNNVISKFKEMWRGVTSWYTSNVAPKFTKKYWADTFNNIVTGLKEKLDDAWEKVKKFFSASEWKKKVTDAVDAIKNNFKMPSLPKIKLDVTWDTKVGAVKQAVYKALGLDGWPNLKWSTYAGGGSPSMGEMFVAREAGPELVGRIGNRSTVMNNDQIVEAVAQGVYGAVVAAMGESNGGSGQNVNVYIDGKQVHASVKRTEAQRGANLMGNQLGYLY